MLWLKKYMPKSFEDINGHAQIISLLKSYNLANLPHLVLYGQPGFGKKTLVTTFINHLYNKQPVLNIKTTEIKNNTKTIEVSFLESNEYIEICPSDYGYQDKLVMQAVIKEIAKFKPVMSFFTTKRSNAIKIIVINSAHDLTNEAQAALRRTIEIYSEHFRIIMVCNQLSKLIEPIRSRCVLVRVAGYNDSDINQSLQEIILKEEITIDESQISDLIDVSSGNIRKAICMLELWHLKKNQDLTKRQKIDIKNMKVDWEGILDDITAIVRRTQKTESMIEVRKKLYLLHNSCIQPKTVILELYKRFVDCEKTKSVKSITNLALIYEERLNMGTKSIYHIEAFIIGCMQIFQRK